MKVLTIFVVLAYSLQSARASIIGARTGVSVTGGSLPTSPDLSASVSITGGSINPPAAVAARPPPSPTVVPIVGFFESVGCFSDSPQARILHDFEAGVSPLTAEACIAQCNSEGLALAGLEFGQECFCGNAILNENNQIAASNCDTACAGNSKELCGGANAINLYLNLLHPDVTSGRPTLTRNFGRWSFLTCSPDNVNGVRELPTELQNINHEFMTVETCLNGCQAAGFKVAGLQFAQECWCGNVNATALATADVSNCDLQCTDNANEFCGGSGFNQIYVFH